MQKFSDVSAHVRVPRKFCRASLLFKSNCFSPHFVALHTKLRVDGLQSQKTRRSTLIFQQNGFSHHAAVHGSFHEVIYASHSPTWIYFESLWPGVFFLFIMKSINLFLRELWGLSFLRQGVTSWKFAQFVTAWWRKAVPFEMSDKCIFLSVFDCIK